ncbi:MAG: CsgG/HfaB family protein [Geobacteraceae bacterium]|nr:CsgG/HfaB family protein [Geobacteraceae bacterium]
MNNMSRTIRSGVTMVLVLFFGAMLSGCQSSPIKPYISKNFKGGEGMKMAILPFDNMSKTQGAGKALENIMMIELLSRTPLTVVDPGEVSAALSQERVRMTTTIKREAVRNLGKNMGVNFLMVGAIHEYDFQSFTGVSGAIPVIAITMRLIDTNSGDIVWAGNATRRGNDRETVFGIGRIQSMNALAEQVAIEFAEAINKALQR